MVEPCPVTSVPKLSTRCCYRRPSSRRTPYCSRSHPEAQTDGDERALGVISSPETLEAVGSLAMSPSQVEEASRVASTRLSERVDELLAQLEATLHATEAQRMDYANTNREPSVQRHSPNSAGTVIAVSKTRTKPLVDSQPQPSCTSKSSASNASNNIFAHSQQCASHKHSWTF